MDLSIANTHTSHPTEIQPACHNTESQLLTRQVWASQLWDERSKMQKRTSTMLFYALVVIVLSLQVEVDLFVIGLGTIPKQLAFP